ncbi:uncharacterized protein LOC113507431 [Trichoplusia ni]|uniref:Uncharacterized protein LOC113507431 n=1 Tax=Trichoplusia ni TaxID=7111 RepID=A0A7E5X078_TRINI|nr:uncharacterized protein LOC113507431 [Trichoplusia ni]
MDSSSIEDRIPMGGSQPDLSTIFTNDPQVTLRKRKIQDHSCEIGQQLSDFRKDIVSLLSTFTTTHNDNLQKMRQDITSDIKEQINRVASLSESLVEEQNIIKADLSALKDRLNTAEKEVLVLSDTSKVYKDADKSIKSLIKECNNAKQFSMLNNLEISGIPFTKGENLYSILRDLCLRVGFALLESDVDTIHRVRRFGSNDESSQVLRPPAIIVRFTQRKRKNELLAAVRARRGLTTAEIGLPGVAVTVYVGDHLTPANKLLLKQARELKAELQYTYLWIRDCTKVARIEWVDLTDDDLADPEYHRPDPQVLRFTVKLSRRELKEI